MHAIMILLYASIELCSIIAFFVSIIRGDHMAAIAWVAMAAYASNECRHLCSSYTTQRKGG